MFERARIKHYAKLLGEEAGPVFSDFEDQCEREPGGTPFARKTLEWLVTMSPEDRLVGIRVARHLLTCRSIKEAAVPLITRKNRLEFMSADCRDYLAKEGYPEGERRRVSDTLEAIDAELKKKTAELDEIKADLIVRGKQFREDWALCVSRYGDPPIQFP